MQVNIMISRGRHDHRLNAFLAHSIFEYANGIDDGCMGLNVPLLVFLEVKLPRTCFQRGLAHALEVEHFEVSGSVSAEQEIVVFS